MGKTNNIGTFTLTSTGGPNSDGVYTIAVSDGVSRAALLLSAGGAATVSGNATIKGFGGASTSIDLEPGLPMIISSNNENEYLDVLTITVTSGTIKVLSNQ